MIKNIGIDFDNTIVTYDNVFYKYACKRGLITPKAHKNKKAIQDAIRSLPEGESRWTELQGLVYGTYIEEAEPMRGVERFLGACQKSSFRIFIISHKTLYPAMGPRVNLQTAARRWLKNRNFLSKFGLADSDVVFEGTLEGKLGQIFKKRCAYFIDDLVEVLIRPDFPKGVKKILYGNQDVADLPADIIHFKDWNEITEHFFG